MMKAKVFILLSVVMLFSCVENVSDVNTAKPTIKIISPTSGDTVQVGSNYITYEATEGGSPLKQFEVVLDSDQGRFVEVFPADQGTSTEIYLTVDSTLLGTSIDYFVNVADSNGTYATSDVQEGLPVILTLEAPSAPGNLVLTKITSSSVNLSWDDSSNTEDNYELWRKAGSSGEFILYKTLPENTISYNDVGLSELIVYYYKVRAINKYGESAFSNTVNTSGGESYNLQAQTIGASQILLTWESNEVNIMGFKIQRTEPTTGNFEQIAIASASDREYTDSGLLASTSYSYRIASFTSTSQSQWSNVATATTAGTDVPAPTNLMAEFDTGLRNVVVQWTDNTDNEVGTYIERREGATGDFIQIGSTETNDNTFLDSTYSTETTYYYRARHLTNEGFYTSYSNTDDVYVPELAPLKPTTLQIYEVQGAANQFSLIWNDNSTDEDGFNIFSKLGSSGTYSLYATVDAKADTGTYGYTISVSNTANEYFFKVRSFKGTLNSEFSNEVSTKGNTNTIVLTIPEATIGTNSAILYWEDIFDNEFVYIIERKQISYPTDEDFVEISNVGGAAGTGTTLTYIDSDLNPNTQYKYRIKAFLNTQQYSNYSNEVTITTPYN